ncbi:type I-F CRISPR-associated protein Csy1 [Burkholderia gladioli]|uniref:type I-F CRISPR-associated protein Csy1 n=1 Tax=Burkholderia gladioli TaxID=28095 RepID=UPI0016433744|nr:type I-F CRISPR-associated protein Csy1 [Burkholderia gladioli]
MSDFSETPGHSGFSAAIDALLQERLQTKLEKLPPDDPKRSELIADHARHVWLRDAARRVKQIQAVTHSLKPIHPDARGTNLYVSPAGMSKIDALGSHALGERFATDVVGNAAALDVVKLLKVESSGRTLLAALEAGDADALSALDDDPAEAEILRQAFLGLIRERESGAASHERAKQVYWLTGSDAADDSHFHLLAPLYPTSLVQAVYDDVNDARFGEANKLARLARRDGEAFDGVYREYRDVAVQKLGGTKPQNISQLNSERRGVNYLLSSLPPSWERRPSAYLPVRATSVFDRAFGARADVRGTLATLRAFLGSDPTANRHARARRTSLMARLGDELVVYAGELHTLEAGWTRGEPFSNLSLDEKLWLDPSRAELPEESEFAEHWLALEWPARVADRFAKWLNAQLRDALPHLGADEAHAWKNEMLAYGHSWSEHLRQRRRYFGSVARPAASAPETREEA